MNLSFYRRDRTNPEMDSCSLTVSLLMSLVFMQFVSAADQNKVTIKAEPGENVILICKDPDQDKIKIAEWKRTDLGSSEYVLLYKDNQLDPGAQHPSYRDRVDLQLNQLRKGDVSLLLKNTTTEDSGTYECRIDTEKLVDKLISTINLQVSPPDPFPVWAIILLVLLVLVLVAAPVLIYWLWYRFSVHQVEVEPGVESVLLPWRRGDQLGSCWFTSRLPGDVRVEWRDEYNRKVHVHQNGSDCSDEQNQRYRNRTKMDKNLSLTLKRPTCKDNGFYTCGVYSSKGDVLMEKDILLKVKVQQVEVKSGDKSVLLPWTIRESLDGDVRVEWRDREGDVVHVYQDGSDRPDEQTQSYKHRTRMDKNPLKTKNLSLTLMDPTYSDTFTCRVSNRKGDVLMMKQVHLKVKDQQVEFDEGAESVKLSFKVTFDLLGGDKVEWWDKKERKVHEEQIGSDQPVEQDKFYKGRTKMDEKLLETKDVSLTLIKPTDGDTGDYRCGVYRDGDLLRIKTFHLNIKAKRNQVQSLDTRKSSLDQPEETRKPLMADQSV